MELKKGFKIIFLFVIFFAFKNGFCMESKYDVFKAFEKNECLKDDDSESITDTDKSDYVRPDNYSQVSSDDESVNTDIDYEDDEFEGEKDPLGLAIEFDPFLDLRPSSFNIKEPIKSDAVKKDSKEQELAEWEKAYWEAQIPEDMFELLAQNRPVDQRILANNVVLILEDDNYSNYPLYKKLVAIECGQDPKMEKFLDSKTINLGLAYDLVERSEIIKKVLKDKKSRGNIIKKLCLVNAIETPKAFLD